MHHLIKVALVALATVAAYFVYGFTAAVAPWPVAVASAGSLVGTYLGLAFADIPARQRDRANRVALGAMLIEACYGTLYVLNLQAPAWFVAPPWFVAVPLAVLHGASFSIILSPYAALMCQKAHKIPLICQSGKLGTRAPWQRSSAPQAHRALL